MILISGSNDVIKTPSSSFPVLYLYVRFISRFHVKWRWQTVASGLYVPIFEVIAKENVSFSVTKTKALCELQIPQPFLNRSLWIVRWDEKPRLHATSNIKSIKRNWTAVVFLRRKIRTILPGRGWLYASQQKYEITHVFYFLWRTFIHHLHLLSLTIPSNPN